MDAEGNTDPTPAPQAAPSSGARRTMTCPACDGVMRFEGGSSTHDLYSERFVCGACGRVEYRSFGRGSVS